ncbi:MAG: phosphate ABC transporter ATP-binding protein [Bacteroidetes bacterium]|jgi:phosphate transport system ATP-binding protein|nr:phosphate ABC transporter ATP-binding protein [Bacteroidota bacterium]
MLDFENPKLEIDSLRLSFGNKEVLKGIDLHIPERKIVALIGPSGCGKSTLLRSINRMHDLTPTARISGDIRLDRESVYHAKADVVEVRRRIGMVFQKPNPFPKSIFDNIAYGLRINGQQSRKHLSEVVQRSLQDSYLWEEVHEQLDKSALELSGGQQQRLCIARSIAVQPHVLLMDEPCSALDPISTDKIEQLMLKLREEYTIVIVTHNMQQAQRVADYTAFMYLGELIEYAPTQEIFEAPKHELTQRYIGGGFG